MANTDDKYDEVSVPETSTTGCQSPGNALDGGSTCHEDAADLDKHIPVTAPIAKLDRETNSTVALVLISSASVLLDLCRQLSSYAMRYYNEDTYPVPTTLLVFLSELLKCVIFGARLIISGKFSDIKLSYAYVIPSLFFAINTNIYFFALIFTSPPVWNILMLSRVILTAAIYRFYFKKSITKVQWFALLLLSAAIGILQLSSPVSAGSDSRVSWRLVVTLTLALVASLTSTVGPIITEYLLKTDNRQFDDKQYQIYFFGSFINLAMFVVHGYLTSAETAVMLNIRGDEALIQTLMCLCVMLTAGCGLIVAVIIKRLDNIVKLYCQAVSSGFTCLACGALFPRMFQYDVMFLLSLVLASVAIYLYEVKRVTCCAGRYSVEL